MVGKVLNALGLEESDDLTPDDHARARRYEQYSNGWSWLRGMLDRHISECTASGDFGRLERLVAQPLRDRLIAHLNSLRSQGLVWSMPDRAHNSQALVEIINDETARDRSVIFTVRESFNDVSVIHDSMGTAYVGADRRVIEARVICTAETEFILADIRQVDVDS